MKSFEMMVRKIGREMKEDDSKVISVARMELHLYRHGDAVEIYTADPYLKTLKYEGEGFSVDGYADLPEYFGKVEI